MTFFVAFFVEELILLPKASKLLKLGFWLGRVNLNRCLKNFVLLFSCTSKTLNSSAAFESQI